MKLIVLLADDHVLFRDGMRYLLQQLNDQITILCSGSFSETIAIAASNPVIDLALLDLQMPGSDGVGSVRIFNQRFPHIPVVVVSGSDNPADIDWAMEYGAMGFIAKSSSAKEMLDVLRSVLVGDRRVAQQLSAQSAQERSQAEVSSQSPSGNIYGLTKRQIECLQNLTDGLTNKEMSVKMKLADGTVKAHVAAVFQVLKVGCRTDAVRRAVKLGLVQLAREDKRGE